MTNGMKMLLLNNTDNGGRNYPHTAQNERISGAYNRMGGNYTHEPTSAYSGYDKPENRRYKNGRYAPKNGGYDYDDDKEWEEPEMRYDTSMHYGEHKPQQMQMGFAVEGENAVMPFNRLSAEKWMKEIENEDGTKGAHWTLEQAKQLMAQKGIKADPVSFWVVLNSMYADYCKTFKKYGVGDKIDFYVDLTKDFLNDKDSVGGDAKVAAYFEHIVKH